MTNLFLAIVFLLILNADAIASLYRKGDKNKQRETVIEQPPPSYQPQKKILYAYIFGIGLLDCLIISIAFWVGKTFSFNIPFDTAVIHFLIVCSEETIISILWIAAILLLCLSRIGQRLIDHCRNDEEFFRGLAFLNAPLLFVFAYFSFYVAHLITFTRGVVNI